MENLDLDLTKILKDCPKGTKLYSPLFGEVTLNSINPDFKYPIEVMIDGDDDGEGWNTFTKDGRYCDREGAECLLFPSMNCRDWSQFRKPEPKPKPAFNFFKPFDRVLVRDDENCCWEVDFFDHYNQNDNFPYRAMTSGYRKYCIPYDGNEHLNGTICEPKSGKV